MSSVVTADYDFRCTSLHRRLISQSPLSSRLDSVSSQQLGRRETAHCGSRHRFGWRTLIEYDDFPLGLNEDVVRAISAKKAEPEWLLDFRLRAYRRWLTMKEPAWSDNRCRAFWFGPDSSP